MRQKLRYAPKGFTIIEIMIVLVVISLILLAIFLAAGPARRSQRDETRKDAAAKTATALIDYATGNGNDFSGFSCSNSCDNISDPDSITGKPVQGTVGVSATKTSGVTYVIGGACGTGTDAGTAVSSTGGSRSYAILYYSEVSDSSMCMDSSGSTVASASGSASSTVSGGGGVGSGGSGTSTSWSGKGGVYTNCYPSLSRCMQYSGGAGYTAWAPTEFEYTIPNVEAGTKTLYISYKNTSPLPSSYPYFNVNIYVNGVLTIANQHMPINTDGTAPGPYVINMNNASNVNTIGVEWTNDWCCGTSPSGQSEDANFVLLSLSLG